jgi:hypothetical protein
MIFSLAKKINLFINVQPMAQQQLLKYLNMRKVMNHLIYNLDFLDNGVKNLIDNGYIIMSPIRDRYGRRTILYFASEF